MIHSETMGHSFWLDASTRQLMSAPTFVEGNTPDFDNALFVEDWEGDPLEIEQVNELVYIYYRLVHRL